MGADRADHLLRGGARLGRAKPGCHQEIPRCNRRRRCYRQQRSRQGFGLGREIHQAAHRTREGDGTQPIRTGPEGRAAFLVARNHVVAKNAADQTRSQPTDPELGASMASVAQGGSEEVSGWDTLSERAANLVERDIIAGLHAPGARLGINDLVQRYEIGATPLREGLSRLISRGLIIGIGQRGFRVADISREDLLDITRMRTVVEIEALRLAMTHGDDAWEAGIVSALHQMRRHIERTGNEFREGAPDFDRLHKGFHTALLAACGSKRLLTAHSDLYDHAYRYRRVMMRSFATGKKFVRAHQLLAERVIGRDVQGSQAMLEAHLRSTMDI